MSEHFSTATKIILARIESHPEEFKEPYGKWGDIMEAIQERLLGHKNRLWGMTSEEVEAVEQKLRTHIWAPQFNDAVMEKVLDPQKEERAEKTSKGLLAQGKRINWSDPRLAQNAIQPNAIYEVPKSEIEQRAEQLGLGHLLKKTINKIKL